LARHAWTGQDRRVTESQSPLDAALDLLVYAPVGLALTAAEEIPKLATKGRAQLEGQLTMARVVGQFAVAQGRKELKKRLNPPPATRRPGPGAPGARSATPPTGAPSRARPASGVVGDSAIPAQSGREVGAGPSGSSARAESGAHTSSEWPGQVPPATVTGGDDAMSFRPAARSLAIPGYDSLAASQVVQRLAGLSKDELEAVGAYEAAHRSRRTILSRIRQLQGS
jgi:hypothetical protein